MNQLKKILCDCPLKDKDGQTDLSKENKDLFLSFMDKFCLSKKILIYRGESEAYLEAHYNVNANNFHLLPSYIFIIGTKGSYFYEKHLRLHKNEDIFGYIFDNISDKICRIQFESEKTRTNIEIFLNENIQIKTFFEDKKKKDIFLRNIEKCSEKDRIKIRDYYFSLFHTIGKSCSKNSYFLSSSISLKIANNFRGNNGIVLIGWVPKNEERDKIIGYQDICKGNDLLKKLDFPTYSNPLYPEQKEICLKCGMLPHYIIGFITSNSFVINPAIFNDMKANRPIDDIIQNGLDIDQKDFLRILKKTNYARYYVFDDGIYSVPNNV